MSRVCQKWHGNKLPKEFVVSFCMNSQCLNRFACSQCVQEFHNDHLDNLIPIANLNRYVKDTMTEIQQSQKQILIDDLNKRKIALIKEIETQCNAYRKTLPQITENITEQQLNQLQQYLNWQVDVDKLSIISANFHWIIQSLQSGLEISRIYLLVKDLESDQCKYSGEILENERFGYGIAKYSNGNSYAGDWVEGVKHGVGLFESVDGTSYNGQWLDGTLNGYGKHVWPDGRKYDGFFKDGLIHGQGTFEWPNGNMYAGSWKEGKRNGHGIFKWGKGQWEGDVYEGFWKDDQRNTFGTYFYADGKKYRGQFEDNRFHGHGTLTLPDGRKYEGNFKDDAFNGKGEFKWPDGGWYEGDFVNNEFSGNGKLLDEHGYLYMGSWEEGKKQGVHIMYEMVKVEQLTCKDDQILKRKKL